MPVIILPSLNVIRCTVTEKSCAQTVLLKSMLYAVTMATVDTTTFFSHNMQSFIQAHTPTKFEVHSLSTLENHILKFSLPLKVKHDFNLLTSNLL